MKTFVRKSYKPLSLLPLLILLSPVATAVASNPHATPFGSVFTMSNSPSGNSILAYNRSPTGLLIYAGSFATGGLGASGLTGSNQGGVVLSQNGNWLLVVDVGSNQLSVFRVFRFPSTSLALTDVVYSGGVYPISVAISGNLVYVLNNGTSETAGNIAGFYLSNRGALFPIPGSISYLSSNVNSKQISFNPAGTVLAVTEKTGSLVTYVVNHFGTPSSPTITASNGIAPYGFAFDSRGQLIVSDAGSDALSSYAVSNSGSLTAIAPGPVSNGGQAAPCWVVDTANGNLAFTTDAHIGTISSYSISYSGSLTLLHSVAATTSGIPDLDMALGGNSNFLYVYDAGTNTIQGFAVHSDGTLTSIQTVSGIPAGADGLAAN
jgi:hypothetical protein